jgi:hypothetical protein
MAHQTTPTGVPAFSEPAPSAIVRCIRALTQMGAAIMDHMRQDTQTETHREERGDGQRDGRRDSDGARLSLADRKERIRRAGDQALKDHDQTFRQLADR